MSLLGNRVVRTEDPRFLTGSSQFVADLVSDGCLHAAFVRSTIAHGEIGEIDTTDARSMPGVVAILTAADVDNARVAPRTGGDASLGQPLLAVDRVRFVGEPVVAVVAETAAQAADAAEQIFVDIDPLPIVTTLEQALLDETVLFEAHGSNVIAAIPVTPTEIDFADCEVVVERVIVNQRMAPAPLEARVGLVDWSGDRLRVWASCQGAGPIKEAFRATFDLDAEAVHVIAPDIGGGFGAKGAASGEDLTIAAASRTLGRPVRWAETRSENLTSMVHARGQRQHVRMGGTRDGRITHYALHVDQEAGAYSEIGAFLPALTMMMAPGTYDIENVQYSSQSVVTNTTPVGAFRGAGRPEAAAAIERSVDIFAAEIGMDPADVRRKNLLPAFSEPYANAMGTTYDVGDYPAALDKALDAAGYVALRAQQATRRANGDRLALGIGIASYVEITAIGGPDGSSEIGTVELLDDATVLAKTGSTPHGQGHETTWAMIIADELGVPFDNIRVMFGDSDEIPSVSVTGGSRSAQIAGSAMFDASLKLVDAARQTAASLLEANEADVVLDKNNGVFHVVGTPAVSIGWDQIAAHTDEPLVGISDFIQPNSSFPFGAHVSVVEVDLDTGAVTLQRHIAVDDCGTILNRLLAEGQVHGGLASGAAQALIEEIRFDENGTPMTSNFADYGIISAAELPSFERVEMVTPSPLNPIGAKGIGESGTIGSTPAVHNAVVDAVAHLGVRHIDMPCTAERVWRSLPA
jgi:carbon-monoxide dehydrogenase large subunit